MSARASMIAIAAVAASLIGGALLGLALASRPSRAPGDGRAAPTPEAPSTMNRGGSRSSVPRFSVAAPPALVTDPRKRGYDAAQLVLKGGKMESQVYADEPRDPSWAPVMERTMAPLLEADMRAAVPGGTDVAVECRTQSCRVEVQVEDPADSKKVYFLLQLGRLGKAVSFTPGRILRKGVVEAFVVMDEELRDVAVWQRENAMKRKAFLEAVRKRPPGNLPVPVADLPQE